MVPSLGSRSPVISLSSVDLPTPFAPTTRDPVTVADAEPDITEQFVTAGELPGEWLTAMDPTGAGSYDGELDGHAAISSTSARRGGPSALALARWQ